MAEVVVTDEFREWYEPLDEEEQAPIYRAVALLAQHGPALGYPHSSQIKGSKYPLRELRIQDRGHVVRVFYAFDPQRQAVLLIGGDKTGDDRFYERMVPLAEKIWEDYRDGG